MTCALVPEVFDRRMPPAPTHRIGRHGAWTIALHWASALATFVSVGAVLCRELVDDSSGRRLLMAIHRQLGLLILVAWSLRVTARFSWGMARRAGYALLVTPALERIAANLVHLLLYALRALRSARVAIPRVTPCACLSILIQDEAAETRKPVVRIP